MPNFNPYAPWEAVTKFNINYFNIVLTKMVGGGNQNFQFCLNMVHSNVNIYTTVWILLSV